MIDLRRCNAMLRGYQRGGHETDFLLEVSLMPPWFHIGEERKELPKDYRRRVIVVSGLGHCRSKLWSIMGEQSNAWFENRVRAYEDFK